MTSRLDSRSLVVTVGASASGKSTWAQRWFRPEQVVSTDDLRAAVGQSARDQRASRDAFDLLDHIVSARLGRHLLTVIDSTGLTDEQRQRWRRLAADAGVPAVAVVFELTTAELDARNRSRRHPVPARVVAGQARKVRDLAPTLADEGWLVLAPDDDVLVVPPELVAAPAARARQEAEPMPLTFGLSLPRFAWDDAPEATRDRLREVARTAEEAGFAAVYVMDHLVQVPTFGPVWEDMLESTTTLGYLAGVTERVRLGALVTGVTYRNVGLVGKAVATLDVLSGGRAACGLGAGWFAHEHDLYGYPFPPLAERYRLLEDALRFLPLLWGPGTPPFEGHTFSTPKAVCYPRPLQDPRPPILVGGSGERRTLRLVAEHADACNLIGGPDLVRAKLAVLGRHCAVVGRDPDDIEVTQLGTVLVGRDRPEVARIVDEQRPPELAPETYAERVTAGTVDDHVGRFRELAEAGVGHAIVSLPPVATPEAVERFAPVIAAFH